MNTSKIYVGTGEYNIYTINSDIQNSSIMINVGDYNISCNWLEPTRPYLTTCECCGAPLEGNKCEYCGSTYIWR